MVGRVIGTEDATPLEFWVGVAAGGSCNSTMLSPWNATSHGELVHIFGMVGQVRARHEGARFDSDVFLIEEGVLPAEVARRPRSRPPGSSPRCSCLPYPASR